MYGNIEKLQEEKNIAFEEYWQKKVKLLKELAYSEVIFYRIKKFLRHKKRSIARRNLGKIYHKKLSIFDSWMKNKCRVYNIRERKY